MRRKSKVDRATRLNERKEIRQKNIVDYFQNMSRHHREWLKKLSQDYKEKADFGIHAFILADYYHKPEDKVIALFASLLVSDNDNIRKQVDHLRRLITNEPYQWFVSREFVTLSMGRNQNKRIEGSAVFFWQLSRLFERIYEIQEQEGDMESAVLQTMRMHGCSAFNALTFYLADLGIITDMWWKLNFLLIRLFRKDGLGMELWGSGNEPLMCPYNRGVREFVETWFPDFRRVELSAQKCIRYFGFDDEVDFFYAYLGYKELQRRKPEECGYCATRYRSWYDCGFNPKPSRWKTIIPGT